MTTERFTAFRQILLGAAAAPDPSSLPPDLASEVYQRGILTLLEEDGTPQAVALLFDFILAYPEHTLAPLSIAILGRLATAGSQAACDALYQVAVHTGQSQLAAPLVINACFPSDEGLLAAYHLVANRLEDLARHDPQLRLLSRFYRDATPVVQAVLEKSAAERRLGSWHVIVRQIFGAASPGPTTLAAAYAAFSALERQLTLSLLAESASQGSQAAALALCDLYIEHEEPAALEIALAQGYRPEQPARLALFYFLSGQWEAYRQVDFNAALLASAYDEASPALRKRILAHSRYSGYTDWIQSMGSVSRARWLGDLSHEDWQASIRRLQEGGQFADLWRLAQSAPPYWSAHILRSLSDWEPSAPDEITGFRRLVVLAREALDAGFELRPVNRWQRTAGGAACLAMTPDGETIAAGGSTASIQRWRSGRSETITSPVPVARQLVLNHTAGLLAAAWGDNQIRIFQLPAGTLVKTLSGHTNFIRGLALDPDEKALFSTGFDGSLRAWRFPQGQELHRLTETGAELQTLGYAPAAGILVAAGSSPGVFAWKMPEAVRLPDLSMPGGNVLRLAASPNGELLASYSADHSVCISNLSSGRLLQRFELDPAAGRVTELAITPDEKVILAGTDRNRVLCFSAAAGRYVPLASFAPHAGRVTGLAVSADGTRAASCSLAGDIFTWNLRGLALRHAPAVSSFPAHLSEVESLAADTHLAPSERTWCLFMQELGRWRQRFDIQLSEFAPIHAGEFDIELG
jgi:hypothetical protein